jgi:hypothetical protein
MIRETFIMPFGIMEIAVVYSSKDEELWLELARSYLKWQIINEGYDSEIEEATEQVNEIDNRLDAADIVLLLVSEHFINSDYCWGTELLQVMEWHEARETYVIPLIVHPVDWKRTLFGDLQALPKNAVPVTSWQQRCQAFLSIAQGIREVATRLEKQQFDAPDNFPSPDKIDEFSSLTNIDYLKLRNLLRTGQWRKADYQTYWLMLKGVGRVAGDANGNWIRLEEICNFPYTDLCTIDQLWVRYSNGHFGFSVQRCIWQEKQPEDSYRCEQFFQQIGWLNTGENCQNSGYWKYYHSLTFSLEAPQGHLPAVRYWGWFSGGCGWVALAPGLFRTLFSRLP